MYRAAFILLAASASMAVAAEHEQDPETVTCAAFAEMDIEDQKRTLAELVETQPDAEVPPESLLAGEERVTLIVAACDENDDAMLADAVAGTTE